MRPRYRLILEPMPDQVPEIIRLRSLLKCAKRSFKFRAVSIEPVKRPKRPSLV